MATRLKEAIKERRQNMKCSEFKPHSSPCRECDFLTACSRFKKKQALDTRIRSKQKLRSIRLREGSMLKSQIINTELDEGIDEIKEIINCSESDLENANELWYFEVSLKYSEFDDSNYGSQNSF